ncbi:hypothetical protein KUH32_11725 [Thalassococcus sp. CAU 1522]|uniref:Uncharacterized protein n=1 Tax=Thalassococcus arenae TaxID=2851652 RepID=A0ABS6N8W2_9RHOB|nr:hypothetical protein [Thalassococcus arenae]MBV2360446.1 hypothetical protein [Thalassococcus arenae]
MTAVRTSRGGVAVGLVADMDRVEAQAVHCLRLWHGGPPAQARVWNDFATALGPAAGRRALKSVETMCGLWNRHARRPPVIRPAECPCLGADEACFGHCVAAASDGAHDDALIIACAMVRADVAPLLVGLAEELGLALRRAALAAQPRPRPPGHRGTLH